LVRNDPVALVVGLVLVIAVGTVRRRRHKKKLVLALHSLVGERVRLALLVDRARVIRFFAVIDGVSPQNHWVTFRSLDWDVRGKAVPMRPSGGISRLLRFGVVADRILWVERQS
jgi:hypothetical protein